MNSPIPYAKHNISEEDIDSVVSALRSGYLSGGPKVEEFENNFSSYVQSSHALAVSSGTAALHLAVAALGGEKGKKVLVPSLTFAATANAALYSGLIPEFIDIDPQSFLVDINQIESKLDSDPEAYAGIIVVDFAGLPVDTEKVYALCRKYGLWIIEDAAHSLGGSIDYNGSTFMVGSSPYVDITVFSFHPAKHITCGEGGMITTNNVDLYNSLKLMRSHAMNRDFSTKDPREGWRYEISGLGYNYRLSDLNAALGNSQLSRISQNIKKRNSIADYYERSFKGLDIILPHRKAQSQHAFHLYVIQVKNRLEMYNKLKDAGIFSQVHYVPLHMQPFYADLVGRVKLPDTENYYSKCLSIPLYPTLQKAELERVVESVKRLL